MWPLVIEILAPVLTALIAILVPALVTALVRWFQKLGLDIEATHREALQSAVSNAAMIAIARGLSKDETRKAATRAALDYVKSSVPDAVDRFKLDDQRIFDLIAPKITAARLGRASAEPGA